MTFGMVPGAGAVREVGTRHARQLIPAGLPRRGEVLAACAVAIVVAHLALAPVTLLVAITLAAVGRASRWRLYWLLAPAAVGLALMLVTGPASALSGFAAWPSDILGSLSAGHLAGQSVHPYSAFRAAGSSLPRQLPVALICGAVEAALLGWLYWLHTDEWAVPPHRPGVLAAVRRLLAAAAIRDGAVLTRDGCALGVATSTGAVAELSWTEMSCGLLVVGDDATDVTLASLQVVHAALRRRKPLIVLGQRDEVSAWRALTAACLATGTPLQMAGPAGLAGTGGPAGFAGPGGTAIAAGTGGTGGTGGTAANADDAAGASRLWGRGRAGHRERQQADLAEIDLRRVVMERSAALLPADSPELTARACAGVAALARDLRAIGVDGDGLVWVPHGELVPAEDLAALLRDAPAAGLLVLIGATSPTAAAELAGLAGAALIHRVTDLALASRLADLTGTRMLPAQTAAALARGTGADAGSWPPSAMPAMPAVPSPPPMAVQAAWAMPAADPARPAALAQPGVPAMPGTDLVRCPVIPARTLRALRRGEFVLAVNVPRGRLIALGRLIPARLPPRVEPPTRETPPGWERLPREPSTEVTGP